MHKHLQYHLHDCYDSITKIPSIKYHARFSKGMLNANTYDIFNEAVISPFKKDYSFNEELYKTYHNYKANHKSIKEDTTMAIQNFIKSNGSIRDLLYRINAISPIEREYMNRANRSVSFINDSYGNHNSAYRTSGRDDTVIMGLMNHEIEAIVLYLLALSTSNITIEYNIDSIAAYLNSYKCTNNNIYEHPPNIRYILIQSLFDDTCVQQLNYIDDYSRSSIAQYIKRTHEHTFGHIIINNIKFNIANIIIRMYIDNTIAVDEVNYNLCRLPVIFDINHPKIITYGESFRKLLQNLTIIFYQLLLFNYISNTISNDSSIKENLNNPIDERFWRNRIIQYNLLRINESYSTKRLANSFKRYLSNLSMYSES